MIHFGKEPSGTLRIEVVGGDDIRDLYQLLLSAGLEQRRKFHGVRTLIEEEYQDAIKYGGAADAAV